MSQKQRDKQQRREARKQKGRSPGLSPTQRQAAYEERCAKRKAHELKLKELAEAERTRIAAAVAHICDDKVDVVDLDDWWVLSRRNNF